VSAPAPRPPARSRYGWLVAVVLAAFIAYVSLNTLRSDHISSSGLDVHARVPPFAAPLALGAVDGDVNVAAKHGQGRYGDEPACRVRGREILNSCQLGERGPYVLAFLATRGTRCTRQLDLLQRAQARHPDLQVAAVAIRGDRGELRALVRRHRWRFPVAWDHDGILANLFGVAVCPLMTYALPGGVVQATSVGELDAAELETRLAGLERAARAKGWRP
jgi:AhpC/TSA family